MIKVGFIGFGNMAIATVEGLIRGGYAPDKICACAKHYDKLLKNAEKYGITPCRTPEEVIEKSDVIIAAIKPYQMEEVFTPLKGKLGGKIFVSVVAGWGFEKLISLLGEDAHCIDVSPNTPVSTGEGVIVLNETHSLTESELETVKELLSPLGTVFTLPANLQGIAGTISGCGPAFAAMFIEALGDAGVYYGLPRETAYALAAQMTAGTGKLYLESRQHPGAMKDAVCSPKGITIAGVNELEKSGFRAAIIKAVEACQNRR